ETGQDEPAHGSSPAVECVAATDWMIRTRDLLTCAYVFFAIASRMSAVVLPVSRATRRTSSYSALARSPPPGSWTVFTETLWPNTSMEDSERGRARRVTSVLRTPIVL